jgi:hypothetical protein
VANFSRTQSVAHRIGPDGSFALRGVDGDVRITGVDGDEVRVRARFDVRADDDAEADQLFADAQLIVDASPGSLIVTERGRRHGFRHAVEQLFTERGVEGPLDVEVEVPLRATVRIDVVSAELQATGLAGEQSYRTVSGDVLLDRVSGSVAINGVSASVTLRAEGPVRLHAGTVSGDLSVVAPRLDELRATSVSGDLEVEARLAGGDHRVETVSGDLALAVLGGVTIDVRGMASSVRSDLPHRSEGSLSRRRLVVGDGAAQLRFSSMSGDLEVIRPRRLSALPAPEPPRPPAPPAPPSPPGEQAPARLAILEALERGEIDVDEAARQLEALGDA